ncbi:MAG: ThuA domain-containing protein [Pirellula sp.]
MKQTHWLLGLSLCSTLCLVAEAQQPSAEKKKQLAALTWTDPVKAAAEDADFLIQGEYGFAKNNSDWGLQVVALGEGKFDAYLLEGGLPGLGWTKQKPRMRLTGALANERVEFASSDASTKIVVSNRKAVIARDGKMITELPKLERSSPTLGAKPPAEAIVLFDGSSADAWENGKIENGLLANNDIATKQSFTDYTLHLEFRTPYKPHARGQSRGNSGVYHQGRYETQVLDSFGLEGEMNETGGIYSIAAPKLNMCLPPLTWQTYDVDFVSAKFDSKGERKSPAKITVRLNGVLVHSDQELPQTTASARITKITAEPGPIFIQHHNNPVFYRNIWIVPKKEVLVNAKTKKLLVVTTTEGFRHGPAIAAAQRILPELAANSNGEFAFDFLPDPGPRPNPGQAPKRTPEMTDAQWAEKQSAFESRAAKAKSELETWQSKVKDAFQQKFTVAELENYDGVVFSNTTGELPLPDGAAFVNWISKGKAFVGMHAATDTLKGMPPYYEMINGSFAGHPWGAGGTYNFVNHDPTHPVVSMFPPEFQWRDEIYQYNNFNPASVHVLISLDMAKSKPQFPYHVPVSWVRNVGAGRLFYTSLGHNPETWENVTYQQHIVAGLRWALKLADGPANPNPSVSAEQALKSIVVSASTTLGKDAKILTEKALSKAKANPEWATKMGSDADSYRKLPNEPDGNTESKKSKLLKQLVDEIEK